MGHVIKSRVVEMCRVWWICVTCKLELITEIKYNIIHSGLPYDYIKYICIGFLEGCYTLKYGKVYVVQYK